MIYFWERQLTICLAELHQILGHIAGAQGLGLPLEVHRPAADHGRLEDTGWQRRLLDLKLDQLLVVAIEIACPAEVRPTVGGVNGADLQLGRDSVRRGLLLD